MIGRYKGVRNMLKVVLSSFHHPSMIQDHLHACSTCRDAKWPPIEAYIHNIIYCTRVSVIPNYWVTDSNKYDQTRHNNESSLFDSFICSREVGLILGFRKKYNAYIYNNIHCLTFVLMLVAIVLTLAGAVTIILVPLMERLSHFTKLQ